MNNILNFESYNNIQLLNEGIDKKYISNFLYDFGFFMTLNLSQVTKMGVDKNSTEQLTTMMKELRKPIINGMSYTELIKDVNYLCSKPRLLSEVLNKIREYLQYIEPRIEKFVTDGEYKKNWLNKIQDFKTKYMYIVKS